MSLDVFLLSSLLGIVLDCSKWMILHNFQKDWKIIFFLVYEGRVNGRGVFLQPCDKHAKFKSAAYVCIDC